MAGRRLRRTVTEYSASVHLSSQRRQLQGENRKEKVIWQIKVAFFVSLIEMSTGHENEVLRILSVVFIKFAEEGKN